LKRLEQLKLRHVAVEKHKKLLDPLLVKLNDSNKDWISHFVLRLAYCRTEDLRRWFLAQEVALLKWRLGQASSGSTTQALKDVLPDARLLSQDELEALLPLIVSGTPGLSVSQQATEQFYQVPFTHALDLVQHRQVFVRRGMAYVPESKLVNLVTAKFRTSLSRQLVLLSAVPSNAGLQRTQGFLKNVATVHSVQDEFQKSGEKVTDLNAQNVADHLKHLPLCMAQLQLGLQHDRHLKHWGRLQYGLFLKGAGLSLEDGLEYFTKMFSKDYSKEYGYGLRHMYGKEGKRANYPPYSCSKIINSNAPNANEHHGCPYKHGSVHEVTTLLGKLGVVKDNQKNILAQLQSHQYQLACVEHFKAVHPINPTASSQVDNVGNHPNAWFHASVAHSKAAADATIMIKPDTTTATKLVSVSP
jgi:DNA primase large subunit